MQRLKKKIDITNNIAPITEKEYNFLVGRMYFTDNDGYQIFLVSCSMLNSLILDSNKKVTNWISTGISSEKIKPLDTNFEPTMSNLANGKVVLNLTTLFQCKKKISLLYSKFILNLYIVYKFKTWPCNPIDYFALKNCLFGAEQYIRLSG